MSAQGGSVPGDPGMRPAAARARSERGGIVATEAFSRGDAIDRAWMGWGALRVLSHQQWAPGAVRDEGRVANMERLLLVTEGALDADCGSCGRHRVEAGGALLLGTGHGLSSRLANASGEAVLRLTELWLQPDRVNAPPRAAAWAPVPSRPGPDAGQWTLLAAGEGTALAAAAKAGLSAMPGAEPHAALAGENASLPLRQAAGLLLAQPAAGSRLPIPAFPGSRCWLEVLAGDVQLDAAASAGARVTGRDAGLRLTGGDGLGWIAGDAGAPVAFVASGTRPASLLLLVLPA